MLVPSPDNLTEYVGIVQMEIFNLCVPLFVKVFFDRCYSSHSQSGESSSAGIQCRVSTLESGTM